MMKQEFEKLLGSTVDQATYDTVELVYVYYPGITSKQEIVDIYKIGMVLVNDMLGRALAIKEEEELMAQVKLRLDKLREGE